MCVCVHMPMEAGGWVWMSPSVALHLMFWGRDSVNLGFAEAAGWLQRSSWLLSRVLRACAAPSLSGSGGLNSGSQPFPARSLGNKPSSQLRFSLLKSYSPVFFSVTMITRLRFRTSLLPPPSSKACHLSAVTHCSAYSFIHFCACWSPISGI